MSQVTYIFDNGTNLNLDAFLDKAKFKIELTKKYKMEAKAWTYALWNDKMPSYDKRPSLSRVKKKIRMLNPFRKLKRHAVGFKTDQGFDIFYIDSSNNIIGSKIVLK